MRRFALAFLLFSFLFRVIYIQPRYRKRFSFSLSSLFFLFSSDAEEKRQTGFSFCKKERTSAKEKRKKKKRSQKIKKRKEKKGKRKNEIALFVSVELKLPRGTVVARRRESEGRILTGAIPDRKWPHSWAKTLPAGETLSGSPTTTPCRSVFSTDLSIAPRLWAYFTAMRAENTS